MKEEENSKSEMVDELKSLISSLSPAPEKVKLRAAVAGTVAQEPTQQAEAAAVKLLQKMTEMTKRKKGGKSS